MAIITKKVCNICGRSDCDGKEYITEDMWGSYGFHYGYQIVCKNDENLIEEDGYLMYKFVSGYGDYRCYYVFPSHYTKKQIKREAEKIRNEKRKKEKLEEQQRKIEYQKRKIKNTVYFINSLSKNEKSYIFEKIKKRKEDDK